MHYQNVQNFQNDKNFDMNFQIQVLYNHIEYLGHLGFLNYLIDIDKMR